MRFNIASHAATLVTDILIPASVTAFIVIPGDQSVLSDCTLLTVFNADNPVEVLSDLSLHDLVLLALQVLGGEVKVQLVIGGVSADDFGFVHLQGDRQNSGQSEVRVLDIFAVNFLVDVQQVGVFEFLDWFVSNFTGPVVHSEAAVLQDHLLQVVELITTVVVSIHWF